MKESALEAFFRRACLGRGWECLKLVDQGKRGFPDRTVIRPDGQVFFVELKIKGGKLSVLQRRRIAKLKEYNHRVYVAWNEQDIVEIIECEISRT